MTAPLEAAAVDVNPAGPLRGRVAAPASKSVTNRVLLLAALAEGTSRIIAPLHSDDSAAMLDVISGLGAAVARQGSDVVVSGTGGRLAVPPAPLDARLSGTTMRFGVAVAALAPGRVTLTGGAPLRKRPVGALCDALRTLGASVADDHGYPPVTVGGGLDGGAVTIDVATSSQFASAVLLAAPYARRDVTIHLEGESADAYIAMTVELMRRWGGRVTGGRRQWTVTAGQHYVAREEPVEYDASAAAHLAALAVATAGSVTIDNAAPETVQPDARITDVLAAMGATVTREGHEVQVTGPATVQPVTVDLSDTPDQVTTVAALAALAEGTSTITGVAVTRGHETDRLAALAVELGKVGAVVEERPDGLRITGPARVAGAALETYDDHRLAMAFAALAARIGATIEDPGCVAKTYPAFWDDAAALGLTLTPRPA